MGYNFVIWLFLKQTRHSVELTCQKCENLDSVYKFFRLLTKWQLLYCGYDKICRIFTVGIKYALTGTFGIFIQEITQ